MLQAEADIFVTVFPGDFPLDRECQDSQGSLINQPDKKFLRASRML